MLPDYKLGLIPHERPDSQLLDIRWKLGAPPQFPSTCDNMSGVTPGLDMNDKLGDCGPTSADNHRRIKTKKELGTQQDAKVQDVLALYSASTNPPFDPITYANDSGVQMPDLLNAMRKSGLAGDKIVAFGRLQDISDASIMAAIHVFKAVLFAVDLQVAQQTQSDLAFPVWEYSHSNEWGGHAIVAGAYDAATGTVDVFSWAKRIQTTSTFRRYQLMEVWVPIYQSTIDDANDAIDWSTMADAFRTLTGETLPDAIPAPVPGPAPLPSSAGGACFPGSSVLVDSHIQRSAQRSGRSVADWMNKHFTSYFG